MSARRAARLSWALDREIVIARVFDAPRTLVYRLFTEAEHLDQWWGPRGVTCKTQAMDVRVGGYWRFELVMPDGRAYPKRAEYIEIVPEQRLVFDRDDDEDDDPNKYRVTVTFDEQRDKKTVVMMRHLYPTKEMRTGSIGFGAVELGMQAHDKLAELIRGMT